jgi:uncharacterized protein involved in tolerance to divalent cations
MTLNIEHFDDDKRATLSLEPSEAAVFAAASRIFSAYIQTGKITEDNETKMMNLALKQALQLAIKADKNIRSDNEF